MDRNGRIHELGFQEHKFGYRTSAFKENELILLETTIYLKRGKQEEIKQKSAVPPILKEVCLDIGSFSKTLSLFTISFNFSAISFLYFRKWNQFIG